MLDGLAKRNIFAITSFIFGMDNDTIGVSKRTVDEIESWSPGLPVFGQLTPFPSTPLYDRLKKDGRLHRPKHWLEFAPFVMAHNPLKMSIADAKAKRLSRMGKVLQPGTKRGSTRSDQRIRRSSCESVILSQDCFFAEYTFRKCESENG